LAEEINANKNGTRTVTLNVRLKSPEHTDLPVVSNYTDVRVAQGVAYVNFGFVEPALLMEVGKCSQKGETVPQHIEGSLTTRVALPLDALLRLQQQLSQLLSGMSRKPSAASQ
jgi:hypothetical protein